MFSVDTVAVAVDTAKAVVDTTKAVVDSAVVDSAVVATGFVPTKEALGLIGGGIFLAIVAVVIIYNKMRDKGFKVVAPK